MDSNYPDFVKSTGYGTGPGLCGWNCRHSFSAFWPGISERTWTDEELAELDAKTIEYNGKQYSEYEISQMQRALERKVRKCKREYMALDAAGQDATAEAVNLRQARQALKDFTRATHQANNDSLRTYVPGFGHSQASKATAVAKKEELDIKQYKEFSRLLGNQAPKSLAIFKDLKYNNSEKWKELERAKEQAYFVENAPCVTTPKKYSEYFLKPGAKHSKEFFDVGYTQDNPMQLRYDMAKHFDMAKAVEFETRGNGSEHFNIYMELGVTEKHTFRTAWCKDTPDSIPRIITAFRNERRAK